MISLDMIDHRNYTHNLDSCEIYAQKNFRPEQNKELFNIRGCYPIESIWNSKSNVVCVCDAL